MGERSGRKEEEGATLERFKQVLSFVLESGAPFYREKYQKAGITPDTVRDVGDIAKVPFLQRTELEAVSPWERLYLPLEETIMCGYTSGTTSQRLLPLWRNYYDAELPALDATKILILFAQPWRALGQAEWFRRGGIFPVVGEVGNLPVSAAMAKVMEVDALYCTPTLAVLIAPLLSEHGVVSRIKTLFMTGERLTAMRRESLGALYPNAVVTSHYVSSETGPLGNLCSAGAPDASVYHQDPSFWYEVAHPENGMSVPTGEEGELVITTLTKVPAPMIRYRTGDLATLLPGECGCAERRPSFSVSGRAGFDVVKIGGFELKVDSIERGVAEVAEVIEQHTFEVHIFEEAGQNRRGVIQPRLEYRLFSRRTLTEAEKEKVASLIREKTMVGVRTSLEEAEKNGYLLKTRFDICTASAETPFPKKRKVLVSHAR